MNATFFRWGAITTNNIYKMLAAPAKSALTVMRTPYKVVAQVKMPVYHYRISYTDKMPDQAEFKMSTTYRNLTSVAHFIDMTIRLNHHYIATVLEKFKEACSCSEDVVCNCNCFGENPVVYEIFGDVSRPPPTVKQMEYQLHIDGSPFVYRIGHTPRIDSQLSHMPRFQFEVDLQLA